MCDVTMELVESLRADNDRLARMVTELSQELEQEVEQLGVQAAQDSFISFLAPAVWPSGTQCSASGSSGLLRIR